MEERCGHAVFVHAVERSREQGQRVGDYTEYGTATSSHAVTCRPVRGWMGPRLFLL